MSKNNENPVNPVDNNEDYEDLYRSDNEIDDSTDSDNETAENQNVNIYNNAAPINFNAGAPGLDINWDNLTFRHNHNLHLGFPAANADIGNINFGGYNSLLKINPANIGGVVPFAPDMGILRFYTGIMTINGSIGNIIPLVVNNDTLGISDNVATVTDNHSAANAQAAFVNQAGVSLGNNTVTIAVTSGQNLPINNILVEKIEKTENKKFVLTVPVLSGLNFINQADNNQCILFNNKYNKVTFQNIKIGLDSTLTACNIFSNPDQITLFNLNNESFLQGYSLLKKCFNFNLDLGLKAKQLLSYVDQHFLTISLVCKDPNGNTQHGNDSLVGNADQVNSFFYNLPPDIIKEIGKYIDVLHDVIYGKRPAQGTTVEVEEIIKSERIIKSDEAILNITEDNASIIDNIGNYGVDYTGGNSSDEEFV